MKQQLTLVRAEHETDSIAHEYACNFKVELAGDSLWDCKIKAVTVTGISVFYYVSDDSYTVTVNVTHSGKKDSWRMYTDTGFEAAISDALGFAVGFTEQGMQEDGCASMEA